MTDGRIAVGLIGCGFFSSHHLNSWRDLKDEGVDLVAVCDLDVAKAQAAADAFGVPHVFTNAAAMLEQVPLGLLDIATQMRTHGALVGMALERRIPTIVQKPFAPTIAECEAMVAAARDAGTFLAVHENFRFQAPMLKLRETIESGAIGEPNWARVSSRNGWDIYTGQPYLRDEQRFILLDVGVHVLDVARFLLGEVEDLAAQLQRRNPTVQGEDTATMLCRHASGAVSVVECTYEARRLPELFPQTLVEVEGTGGCAVLRADYRIELTSGGKMTVIDAEGPMPKWAEKPWHVVQQSVLNTCRHMVESVRAGRPAATSAEDNLRTFALVEAAYAAGGARR